MPGHLVCRFVCRFGRSKSLSIVFFLLAGSLGAADSVNPNVRRIVTESDAPRAVLFQRFVDEEFKKSLYEHAPDYPELASGSSNQTDRTQVFDYLILLWTEIADEVSQTQKRMLCPETGKRPHGQQINRIFESFDDVSEAIYEKYYNIAKAELAARQSFNLDESIDDMIANMSFQSVRMRHSRTDQEAEEAARAFCASNHPAAFSRSGPTDSQK